MGHVLYAAVMLPKFYKITSLEKKNFYTGFQQATRLSFTGFSSHWKYRLGVRGVAGTSPASRGGGVSVNGRVTKKSLGVPAKVMWYFPPIPLF